MKTYTLPFKKASDPVTYEQVQKMTKFDNLRGRPSTSQIIKRMEQDMFEEIMIDLENGEDVEITRIETTR